jgi:hypothetical protein
MTGAELRAARTTLGLTEDQMAADLGITPHSYRACENGETTLPNRQARIVTYRVAVVERRAALATSGLPECEWNARWHSEPAPKKVDALTKHVEALSTHMASCPTCQVRERFIQERFPAMPRPPLPFWMEMVGRFNEWVQKRPPWLRPVANGAAVLGVLTLFRAILILPAAARRPVLLVQALGAVLLAAAAGAVGGLAYSLLGRPLRRVRGVGPYLAGIVTVAAYLLAIGGVMMLTGEPVPYGSNALIALVIFSSFIGAFIGHRFLRERTEG